MKKKVDYNYSQLSIIQELSDLNMENYAKKQIIGSKASKAEIGKWTWILDKKGKIKDLYYDELLTDDEKKLINFENVRIIDELIKKEHKK